MLTKEIFLNEFYKIFEEIPINSLNLNTKYKDLEEWDSLIVLSVIAHFDQKFNIIITPQYLFDNNTFEELFNAITTI
jgi:acyl carrier protein